MVPDFFGKKIAYLFIFANTPNLRWLWYRKEICLTLCPCRWCCKWRGFSFAIDNIFSLLLHFGGQVKQPFWFWKKIIQFNFFVVERIEYQQWHVIKMCLSIDEYSYRCFCWALYTYKFIWIRDIWILFLSAADALTQTRRTKYKRRKYWRRDTYTFIETTRFRLCLLSLC